MASQLRLVLCAFMFTCAAATLDYYVAPSGSDSTGTGSASAPWASPLPALSAIAAAKTGGNLPDDVVVHLSSGTYFLQSTLAVTASSGGDGTHTVTFAGPADPADAPAVLSAGAPVAGPWAPVAGAPGVFSASFPSSSAAMLRQAWDAVTGARLRLARSPVMYARVAGDWGVGYAPGAVASADVPLIEGGGELILWHNWVASQNTIKTVNFGNNSISVVGEAGDPFFGAGGTLRWALQNVADPAALAPGSFFVRGRVITYRPASGAAPAPGALIVEGLREAVTISGTASAPVAGVALVNLTIAHAAADLEGSCLPAGCGGQSCSESTNAAVHVSYARDTHLKGVEVVGSGSYAVWFDGGSVDCSITESWLHDLGMGGVRVGSTDNTGSTANEPTRNVTVSDCEIADGGHVVPAGTGVLAQESYATSVVHNHVHHLYYTGVSTGWTWGYAQDSDGAHTVGFNHIVRACAPSAVCLQVAHFSLLPHPFLTLPSHPPFQSMTFSSRSCPMVGASTIWGAPLGRRSSTIFVTTLTLTATVVGVSTPTRVLQMSHSVITSCTILKMRGSTNTCVRGWGTILVGRKAVSMSSACLTSAAHPHTLTLRAFTLSHPLVRH